MDKKLMFAERLKNAMQAQGYKPEPAVLEREFNLRHFGKPMGLHGVRKWLIGASVPSYEKIETLATWLKLLPDELTFGLEIKQKIQEENKRWNEEIGFQERALFEAFLNLPAPQRKVVREVILAFAKVYPNN